MAEEEKKVDDGKKEAKKDTKPQRKIQYRFGNKKLNLYKPTKGYPTKEEAKKKPDANLKLSYSFGYSGAPYDSRQNLYLSNDNKYLIYYIAAVVIVLNIETNEQRFFTAHNDDITALTIDRRENSTKVASGQKDPIDRPGEGKDLPKVYVWDLKDMSKIELIDKVCWGFISKIVWSSKTGYLYVLCGDDEQTLKVFNENTFKGIKKSKKKDKKRKKKPSKAVKDIKKKAECSHKPILEISTTKEKITGMIANPKPSDNIIDEIILFGKRKYSYLTVTQDKKEKKSNGVVSKIKSVSIMKLNKQGEKSFNCGCYIKDGYYAIGSTSGNVYINKGAEAICAVIQAHSKAIGTIIYDGTNIFTGGNDGKLRKFELDDNLEQCKGKKGKTVGMKRIESSDIEVKDSDMKFLPKTMIKNPDNQSIYVGTKTNQIIEIEEKGDTKILIDGHDGQVWGLCTHPTKDLFFTGGYDNCVKLWDAKTLKCLQSYEFVNNDANAKKGKKTGKEVVTAGWSNDGTTIIVGTEDSNLGVFAFDNDDDKFTFSRMVKIPKKNKNSEEENVSYIRFSSDSKNVAVAHMDSNVYVFGIKIDESDKTKVSLESWKPINTGAAPTHVVWSKDGKMIKTLTRDYEIGFFKLNFKKKTGKRVPNVPDPDEIQFADDPLVAGWDVQGLYQPGFDGTDLNDCTLTNDGKLIISGDDYGTIRLHNYPAINPGACKAYTGHAEFVVGVEMLRSGKKLISCGGADMAVFVWDLVKNEEESKEDE